ncbi:MAG: hypothetical protein JXR97_14885 [Planctomycetes bacterium]|nr:hypothetical protein [Planctomycetota bacterium]
MLTDEEKRKTELLIIEIVREHFALKSSDSITMKTNIYDDLGGDSLDMSEIAMEAEDQFGREFKSDDADPRTIADLYRMALESIAG